MIAVFRAGDSWVFCTRSFAGYSSGDGWTLKYVLNCPSGRFVIEGDDVAPAPDGISFAVNVPASETAEITPGSYDLLAVLSKAQQRVTVELPGIKVLPDIAGASGAVDTRSFVKKTLDAIEAALAGDTSMLVQSYEIHGRKIEYTDRSLLLKYRAQFQQEYNQERVARGEICRNDFLRVSM